MARELTPIDISDQPDLLRLAHEVRATQQSRVLRGDGENLAILTPARPSGRRSRRRRLTEDDPLWALVGSATDAKPSDASKKHEYLAEAPRVADR